MTENQKLVNPSGIVSIFEPDDFVDEKIKNDPIAVCVVTLINAMKADFSYKFASQFSEAGALRLYKRRLYQKLKDVELADVYEAYEGYVDNKPEWPPTIPQLIGLIAEAAKNRRKAGLNTRQAEELATLPAPNVRQCNPLALLAEAKQNAAIQPSASWLERKAELIQNHNATLMVYGKNIRKIFPEKACSVPGCMYCGTVSSGIRGDDNFYCSEHFFNA
jgi:hypothetical protein